MTIESFYTDKQHKQYFSTARSEILPLIPGPCERVLDIGCGEGTTLRLLKDRGLARWTCGVDINAAALERARQSGVDVVHQGSLDDLQLPIETGSIDLALCLDILEHLVDPWKVTRTLTTLIKPGGILITSIPNVQSLRVIGPLMIGRWRYKDCGIMDQGHLRFFTRESALALLEQAGLRVEEVRVNTEPHPLPRIVNALTLRLFQRLVTVQFLIRARR